MNPIYRKLFSSSVLNAISAGINFLSNLIIVKALSIEIFGEFAIFSSYLAFGGLLFIIVPPNYSVFKYQDNSDFKHHLLRFFILSSIAFIVFALVINVFVFRELYLATIVAYGITTYFLNIFDISFQANGKIQKYFLMLFNIALLKILFLVIFYRSNLLISLSGLLWSITISQGIILIIYSSGKIKTIKQSLSSPKKFIGTIKFIKSNFSSFTPYYLNTIIKRTRENSIMLVFSRLVSADVLGVFTLFVKIASFVFGLSRALEAFFMNRNNLETIRNKFNKRIIYFAFALQILYVLIGCIYLKTIINKFCFFEILMQSILIYPHVFFLLARAEMLSKFSNAEANVSESLFILIVAIALVASFIFHFKTLYFLLITYTLATLGLQLFMIFQINKTKVLQHVEKNSMLH